MKLHVYCEMMRRNRRGSSKYFKGIRAESKGFFDIRTIRKWDWEVALSHVKGASGRGVNGFEGGGVGLMDEGGGPLPTR